jgi:hypothetical protein
MHAAPPRASFGGANGGGRNFATMSRGGNMSHAVSGMNGGRNSATMSRGSSMGRSVGGANAARGGQNFAQRNFSGNTFNGARTVGRPGGSNFAQHAGSFNRSGTTSTGRQNANFTQRNFSSVGRASGQSLALHSAAMGRNSSQFSHANLAGSIGRGNFAHNANANHNFNGTFNRSVSANHSVGGFNSRWNGGWNNWNNRSYFFGGRSPFGNYYRGYYPYGYGYGFGRGFWPWWGFGLGYYPYYSYGYGYPYGYYGYPTYGYNSYLSYPNYGYSDGYGNSGYASYGYGSPANYGYDTYNSNGNPSNNSAYGGYVAANSGYPPAYTTDSGPNTYGGATLPGPSLPADASNQPPAAQPGAAPSLINMTAADFAGQGEADFKAGKYEGSVRNFRHALVDDPANAGVLILLGQALLAVGQFDEAAGATAMAMQALPQDKWGAVVENYKQLYGNADDYSNQLRALEKARDARPDSPALHFLLGYQFAFLGYRDQALRELDMAIQLEPKDRIAKALRDRIGGQSNASPAPPPPPAPSAPPTGYLPGAPGLQQLGLES